MIRKLRKLLFLLLLPFLYCTHSPSADINQLENGITLISQKKKTPISSAVLLLPYGSAHGTEHLAALMSNTMLRGTDIRTSQQFHEEIELMGGRINIETDLTQTLVWIQAPKNYFNDCFYLLCETVAKPSFDEPEIEMVYQRLLKESSKDYQVYLRTRSWIDDKVREQLFVQSPLARNRYRISEQHSREELVALHDAYVHPSEMLFALVGDIDRSRILKTLDKFWPMEKAEHLDPLPAEVLAGENDCPSVHIFHEVSEPALAYLAVQAPARMDTGCIEMHLLSKALTLNYPLWRSYLKLSSSPNNPLQLRARYQSGDSYGYFYVGTQRPVQDIQETQVILNKFVEHLQKDGIEQEVFEIAKRQLLFELVYGEQFSLNQAIRLALYYGITHPYVWDIEDAIDRVEAVTLSDMNRTLSHVLKSPCYVINKPE